jgi:hypothetical protein
MQRFRLVYYSLLFVLTALMVTSIANAKVLACVAATV